MKKMITGVLLVVLAVCMTGCEAAGGGTGFQGKGKISIVTSIYPVYDFAKHIAGDKAEIVNLVPAGVEPHDFELSTGDMQLLEKADLFFYNGAGMESFVDKTLAALSNRNLVVVEAAVKVDKFEAHHRMDPHTWLSVENAILECQTIMEALIGLDQANAEYYEQNFEEYSRQLRALDEQYKKTISECSGDTIVVAHEAFGYLCDEYGLKQEAVEGLTADSEPDSARLKEIIDFCREHEIKVIFFEELVSPKVAQTIADEVGADTDVLNPVEGLTAEQEAEGLDYIGLMEQNLEALERALK